MDKEQDMKNFYRSDAEKMGRGERIPYEITKGLLSLDVFSVLHK